jgi:glycosyltransferase involved in cell wall biosynthesis
MSRKLTIVRLTTRIFPDPNAGGPAKYAYFLSKSLSKSNLKIINITSNPFTNKNERKKVSKNFEIHYLPIKPLNMNFNSFLDQIYFSFAFILLSIKEIFIVLKNVKRIDAIHADSPSITGIPCILFYLLFKIPYVYTYHGVDYKFKLEIYLYKIINRFAKKIITVSRRIPQYFKYLRWNFKNKIEYIPLGIEVPREPIKIKKDKLRLLALKSLNVIDFLKPDEFLILYVGRMIFSQKVQGMIDFVKGFEIFKSDTKVKNSQKVKLIFIGDGEKKDLLKKYISNSSFRNSIQMIGYQDPRVVQKFYSIAHLSGLTSYVEGFPNVILESMISAVPCIGSDVGEIKSMIKIPELIVPSGAPDRISKCIKWIFEDMDNHQNIANQVFKIVKLNFDWKIISSKYKKIYLIIT